MSNFEKTERDRMPPAAKLEIPPTFDYTNLEVCLIAEGWDLADDAEREALEESIKKIGIQQPVTLYQDDGKLKILDGRNRYNAAKKVGYKFKPSDFKVFDGSYEAAMEYAAAVNDHRRHMTEEQKKQRVAKLLEKYPKMSTRKLGHMAGVSHTLIHKMRKEKDNKEKKDDGKLLDALKKAWDNANYADQEEFVRDYKVDLAEMLEA